MRTEVSDERFEELVASALDGLPEWVHEGMENVEVLVEPAPPRNAPGLMGLYRGIPLTKRGAGYAGVLPDTITLYRASIERTVRDEGELADAINHVVEHEVAHYFGISDDRLRDLDAY